jgi:hypothetical protein
VADEKKPPPYDQRLANQAAAVDHCLKLGGVLLSAKGNGGTGFTYRPLSPEPPREPRA